MIKTFESWINSVKLQNSDQKTGVFDEGPLNYDQYIDAVVELIIAKMEESIGQPLSPMVVGDDAKAYITDLIGSSLRDNGETALEEEPNYSIFKASIGDLYEEDLSVNDAADELVDGCLELYYSHGAAL